VVRTNRLVLALFAAAMLFSMVHEWSLPPSCARAALFPTANSLPAR